MTFKDKVRKIEKEAKAKADNSLIQGNAIIDRKQLTGLISERNAYRKALEEMYNV